MQIKRLWLILKQKTSIYQCPYLNPGFNIANGRLARPVINKLEDGGRWDFIDRCGPENWPTVHRNVLPAAALANPNVTTATRQYFGIGEHAQLKMNEWMVKRNLYERIKSATFWDLWETDRQFTIITMIALFIFIFHFLSSYSIPFPGKIGHEDFFLLKNFSINLIFTKKK